MRVATLLLLLIVASPLCAQPKVGDDAPKFKLKGDVINWPECDTLEKCAGDVVLIYEWEVLDLVSAKDLPVIQKLWSERGGKGLHVFAVHRLNFRKYWDVVEHMDREGFTFCAPMGGFYDASDFSAYKTDKEFRATVISVDGKIAFYGLAGWQAVLEGELKKCIYPGLGKHAVAKPVEEAAANFPKRAYGRALNMAAKLKDSADEAAKSDAELVVTRAEGFAKELWSRVDAARDSKYFVEAADLLERLCAEFKDHEHGKKAEAEIKALKNDKAAKAELKAGEAFRKVQADYKKKDRAARIAALKSFAAKYPDSAYAEDARKLSASMEESLQKK